jgi:hypothetical protein
MIKLFEEYNPYSFDVIYSKAPRQLKYYIDRMKDVDQRPDAHPEGNVFVHTKTVVNRLAKYQDMDLSLAGIFHDLGKFDVADIHPVTGYPLHSDHEKASVHYVNEFKEWIAWMGSNYYNVFGIVSQHMRVKLIDQMNPKKKADIQKMLFYDKLLKFQECDRGGTDI